MNFINFSNHKSENWSKPQLEAAQQFGNVIDVPFPNVSPQATAEEVRNMAEEAVAEIMQHSPNVVMCQGEFTLSYNVVTMLKEQGVTVVAACSDRRVVEKATAEGTTKTVEFVFCGFREF